MRVLKWLGMILLLPALWLGLVLTEWLPRPAAGDAAVIARLKAPTPGIDGKRNAFAGLQSFGFEVPESEWEAVAAADVALADVAHDKPSEAFQSTAAGKYPAYPEIPNTGPGLCNIWDPECLPKIRANLSAARGFVEKAATRLEQGEKLLGYDHYRYGFKPRFYAPIPQISGYFPPLLTSVALMHIDGDSVGAFDRLCRHTAGWRRLRAHTDFLIMDMLGVAMVTGSSRLYAEMLVEMPADFPAPCPEVFAPLADAELNQCAVNQLEFRSLENSIEAQSSQFVWSVLTDAKAAAPSTFAPLVNSQHTKMLFARSVARFCTDEHRERIRLRSAAALPATQHCGVTAWAFDPLGCSIGERFINYDPYYFRVLDLDARLKLLSTVISLHGLAPDAAKAAFDTRPASLRSPEQEMTIDPVNGTLRMIQLDKSRGNPWVLPYARNAG